jgi:hypothetical protein
VHSSGMRDLRSKSARSPFVWQPSLSQSGALTGFHVRSGACPGACARAAAQRLRLAYARHNRMLARRHSIHGRRITPAHVQSAAKPPVRLQHRKSNRSQRW